MSSLIAFMKYGKKRDMRKKPPKQMSSSKPGPKKSPYAPKNPSKGPSKAVYSKVPGENEKSLEKKSYTKMYNLNRPPTNKKDIEELGNQFIEWSRGEDAVIIEEFAIEKGIAPFHFRRLGDKNEYFNDCYQLVRATVAARRERIVGKDLFKAMHPLYHDEWREYLDHRAVITKDKSNASQNITVVMEPYPDSGKVPERVEE